MVRAEGHPGELPVHDPAVPEEETPHPATNVHELTAAALGVVTTSDQGDVVQAQPDRARPGPGWFSPLRAVVLVVVLVAGLVAWDLTRGSSPTYRTAVVGTGAVESTLDSVGTIAPVSQADLNFNASGTVSNVDVSVGQEVTQGQTLASLDVATLNATVDSAHASLASAQATLASAEASETAVTTTTTTTSSHATSTTTPTTSPSGANGSSASSSTVAPLQATLVTDQSQLDADSALAGSSLQEASSACGSSPTTSTTSTTSTSTTTPASGGGTAACSTALTQASSAQAKVAADIKVVSQDERALTAALESSGGGSSGGSTSSASVSGATAASIGSATSGGPAASNSSAGQAAKKATPQQVAVDQASVDTAEANLTDAQQAVSGANLVSTIDGTVASVAIADGDSVTAGSTSSTPQVVVIGKGSSYDLTTSIAVTDIGKVAIGQDAEVTPDSTYSVVQGHVSAIGVVATSGSTTTTYPVTISLDAPDLGQLSGVNADVRIVTQRSVDVTVVPSSAVRTVGTIHLVTEVKEGKPTPVRVTLGTVGDIVTQVKSGVSKGDVVSLANLQEPLPATSSTTTRGGFGGLGAGPGGGGGFGGAGGFSGRFGG